MHSRIGLFMSRNLITKLKLQKMKIKRLKNSYHHKFHYNFNDKSLPNFNQVMVLHKWKRIKVCSFIISNLIKLE